MGVRKMHQTTVRFGADLWEALENECSHLGVSVAQYVREAALARLMYAAGHRGEPDYEVALRIAGGDVPDSAGITGESVMSTLDRSDAEASHSAALWAQGRLARRRAQEIRAASERRRRQP